MHNGYSWWKQGIVYQIYPRSFQDSNQDGIGDLNGIRSRLSYLKDLGITAVWISPIYPSPMVDFGYDISNYTDIHPLFGTLDDFKQLLKDIHKYGLKLILDFVPNHTSNQHPWFLKSRANLDNPKRDGYIWKDSKPDGDPPNNWVSYFGDSAWEWDDKTKQYYLHLFAKEQPDLNWRNPEVRENMLNVMRFWLDIGIDGFRVDVLPMLIKDIQFRDDTLNPDWDPSQPYFARTFHDYSEGQDEVHEIIRTMRKLIDEYGDHVLIGEICYHYSFKKQVEYYGKNNDECHLPFNFSLINCPFNAKSIKKKIVEYEKNLPNDAWPNWVLGNHDTDRIATKTRAENNARIAQMLLLTLRGTPTMYYGDELGMENVFIPPEKYKDPVAVNDPAVGRSSDYEGTSIKWDNSRFTSFLSGVGKSRDCERTPMQWDNSRFAGFSNVPPWLPAGKDYKINNVKVQSENPTSFLNMVKKIIKIRNNSKALRYGKYSDIEINEDDIMVYTRTFEDENLLVILNFSNNIKQLEISNKTEQGKIILSTNLDRNEVVDLNDVNIRKHEGLILRTNSNLKNF